ncbi:MAG: phosphatidate cytidylyltransferase [Alphaproteobacteria bacterium]|nr:phosphatidate cytidylyltransferase [Alphaproteobacteria bacterium]
MEKTKLGSLLKRIVTSLILAPTVIGCLYVGYPLIQLLVFLAGAMLAWEWSRMVPNSRGAFYTALYTFVVGVAVLLGSWFAFFLSLFVGMVLAFVKSKGETRRKLLILGVPYISVGLGAIVWLYELVGFAVTLWFVLVIWAVDVGGYVVGCNLKGPKLAPKISPNKTWSGLIGGMLFSVGISTAVCWYVGALPHALYYGMLAAMIALIAQIGDLVESAIKRSLNLKDSSDLIPGHGGVFDRVDGLIFAAPIVYIFFRYVLFLI